MSWTEPGCHCGGDGWDGCEPAATDRITTGLTELCRTIAADMAGWQGLLGAIHKDTQAVQATEPTSHEHPPTQRALPAADESISQAFENWLRSLERPHA